jgi:multiple sugar transport system ATP-binding protein
MFVAGFIGTPQMNFINSTLEKKDDGVYLEFEGYSLKLPHEKAVDPKLEPYFGEEVVAGIRPELIHDEPIYLANMKENVIDANVDVTELMGAEIYLYLAIDGVEAYNVEASKGENVKNDIIARVSSRSTARAGDKIQIAIDSSRIHLFDKDTQKVIIH